MSFLKPIYKQEFTEKIETLLPEHYILNKYYQNVNNNNQYIMRNSKGYFHIMQIVKTQHGYTFTHYRINKNEMLEDTGEHYKHFNTIQDIKTFIEHEEIFI